VADELGDNGGFYGVLEELFDGLGGSECHFSCCGYSYGCK
jgi:hypothetical protein